MIIYLMHKLVLCDTAKRLRCNCFFTVIYLKWIYFGIKIGSEWDGVKQAY